MNLHLVVDGQTLSLPGVVLLGIAVGFLAGMFGIGGGILLTPMLTVVFRVPLPIAIGSGLCQMVGTSLTTYLRKRALREGEVRVDLLMLVGSVVGVDAGARVVSWLGRRGAVAVGGRTIPATSLVIELLFAAVLVFVAQVFWRQGRAGQIDADAVRAGPLARLRLGPAVALPAVPLAGVSAIVLAEVGLALGFLSGLLGIGGGVVLMAVLVYGYGFPIRQAAGTGVLLLLVTSVSGTIAHAMRGNVHLPLAMVLLVGSSVSAQLGALATRRFSTATLSRGFALVALLAIGALGWDLWRKLR